MKECCFICGKPICRLVYFLVDNQTKFICSQTCLYIFFNPKPSIGPEPKPHVEPVKPDPMTEIRNRLREQHPPQH